MEFAALLMGLAGERANGEGEGFVGESWRLVMRRRRAVGRRKRWELDKEAVGRRKRSLGPTM
jgi:hypothetical protein